MSSVGMTVDIERKPRDISTADSQVNITAFPIIATGTGAKKNDFLNIVLFSQSDDAL